MPLMLLDQCRLYLAHLKTLFVNRNIYLSKLSDLFFVNRIYRANAYTQYSNSLSNQWRYNYIQTYIVNNTNSATTKLFAFVLMEQVALISLWKSITHNINKKIFDPSIDIEFVSRVRDQGNLNVRFLLNVFKRCMSHGRPTVSTINEIATELRNMECNIFKALRFCNDLDYIDFRGLVAEKISEICSKLDYHNIFTR